MNVLLTGASGFVGSHILDRLAECALPTTVLLRPTSSHRFLERHLGRIRIAPGNITDAASLPPALVGITHVIHCAGVTKAVHARDLLTINRDGTRNLVRAIGVPGTSVRRLIQISSLAVSGPGTAAVPARELDPPRPLSAYGRSKAEAESEVTEQCRVPFIILRPAAVYGPRDFEFLRLFRAAKQRLVPVFNGGRQELSLVFVEDLARVVVDSLSAPVPKLPICHVASTEVVTARGLIREIGSVRGGRVTTLPLPNWILPPFCRIAQAWACLTGRATVLAHGKHRELTARGWVADVNQLTRELRLCCSTPLRAGLASTSSWYQRERWL